MSTDVLSRTIYILIILVILLVPLAFWGTEARIEITGEKLLVRELIAELSWSKAFILNLFCGLLLLAVVLRFFTKKELILKNRKAYTLLPVLLFAAITLLSFLKSANVDQSFQALVLVGGSLIIYLITFLYVNELSMVRGIFIASFIAALAVSLFGLFQYFGLTYLPLTQYGEKNPGSFFGLTNFAAEFLLIPFSMAIALFASESKLYKFIFGLGSAMIFVYLVIAENRASWLGLAVGSFLIALVALLLRRGQSQSSPAKNRALMTTGALLLLVIVGIKFTDYGDHLTKRAASIFDPRYSTNKTRLLTWKTALAIYRDHPVLGIGLANTEVVIPKYADAELEAMYLKSNTTINQVHNEYLQILVESGTLGFLAFSLLLLSLARLAISNLKRAADRRQFWYNVGLIAGVASFLINIFFSFALRNPASALYFWLAVGLLEAQNLRFQGKDAKASRSGGGFFPRLIPALLILALATVLSYFTYFSARAAKAELSYNTAEAYLGLKKC